LAYFLDLPTFEDERGNLTVVENVLPFDIKRFYHIYDVTSQRGGHRHIKTVQALICLNGSCDVYVNNGNEETTFSLTSPTQSLILQPEDWHTMDAFTEGSTLMVFASENFDKTDYINEKY